MVMSYSNKEGHEPQEQDELLCRIIAAASAVATGPQPKAQHQQQQQQQQQVLQLQ